MDKLEFDEKIRLINELKLEAKKVRDEFVSKINHLGPSSRDLINAIISRDNAFAEYLKFLDDFSFSEETGVAIDVFPGLKPANMNIDYEELEKKADTMKAKALEINNNAKKIEVESRDVVVDIKRCLGLLTEYILQTNQIYDFELDLIKDMDSVYDIGMIAKATK